MILGNRKHVIAKSITGLLIAQCFFIKSKLHSKLIKRFRQYVLHSSEFSKKRDLRKATKRNHPIFDSLKSETSHKSSLAFFTSFLKFYTEVIKGSTCIMNKFMGST